MDIPQPIDLSARCAVAEAFVKSYGLGDLPLYIDDPEDRCLHAALGGERGGTEGGVIMGNSFERTFAAWPLRFYVIVDGVLVSEY